MQLLYQRGCATQGSQVRQRRVALDAAHPPDPAQARVPPRQDRAASPADRCRPHQELGVCAPAQRRDAGRLPVGPARGHEGRRRCLDRRGQVHRRAVGRAGPRAVPVGARGGLPRARESGARGRDLAPEARPTSRESGASRPSPRAFAISGCQTTMPSIRRSGSSTTPSTPTSGSAWPRGTPRASSAR